MDGFKHTTLNADSAGCGFALPEGWAGQISLLRFSPVEMTDLWEYQQTADPLRG
jgi:hypothetical protein